MRNKKLTLVVKVATIVLAIVILGIAAVNFVIATCPWLAIVIGFIIFGVFCFYMDVKEKRNSRKARK